MDWKQNSYRKNPMVVNLPKLTSYGVVTHNKGSNCSFINNHKTYLKMKGYDLNNVYSLKRNRKHNEDIDSGLCNSRGITTKLRHMSKSEYILPALRNDKAYTFRNGSALNEYSNVWKPNDSRKQNYNGFTDGYLIDGIHEGRKVIAKKGKCGQLNSNCFDSVISRARLRSLLEKEEVFIPKHIT